MTIASDIQRIENAKAAMKAKLIEKGVEVSDSAKLENFAALVDELPDAPAQPRRVITSYELSWNTPRYGTVTVDQQKLTQFVTDYYKATGHGDDLQNVYQLDISFEPDGGSYNPDAWVNISYQDWECGLSYMDSCRMNALYNFCGVTYTPTQTFWEGQGEHWTLYTYWETVE